MFRVQFETPRNLLLIEYSGHVTLEEVKRVRPELAQTLAPVRVGFRLLADLSALEEMDVECSDEIKAIMDQLRKRGVSQIVRVIPDHWKDIGFAVMSRFHYGPETSVQTVGTLAEARRMLGA